MSDLDGKPNCWFSYVKTQILLLFNAGGGTIVAEEGIIAGGVCTGLSPLSTGAHLELQVVMSPDTSASNQEEYRNA